MNPADLYPVLLVVTGVLLAGVAAVRVSSRAGLPSLLLYLAIGWAGVIAGQPLVAGLSPAGFALILAAGSVYTCGVIFYLWERLPFHNTIWHVFVLAASFVLYAAVVVELSGRAAAG